MAGEEQVNSAAAGESGPIDSTAVGSAAQRPATGADREAFLAQLNRLRTLADEAVTEAEARLVIARIGEVTRSYKIAHQIGMPAGIAAQAAEVDPGFVARPHLVYLSDRLTEAIRATERGHNRRVVVSMPPRSGKSTLVSKFGLLYLVRRHPEWKYLLASYDASLMAEWTGQVRAIVEDRPDLGVVLRRDGGALGRWATVEGGTVRVAGIQGGGVTGRGAKVLVIDDPIKDFVDAHSATMRENLWNWWLGTVQTRLEPPYLVVVVATRWHEDDLIGRLLSTDHEGDPRDWTRIQLPALAEDGDPMGRAVGEPLLSPILAETAGEALDRWADLRRNVGGYTWASQYQQHPSPAKGAIFDSGWWRFWTIRPEAATTDGKVVHLDPATLRSARWLDSWDCSFKATDAEASGSYVVGQRWVRNHTDRYLVAQQRGRWSFTATIARMRRWARGDDPVNSPCGHLVHARLVEERANGAAIIDVLRDSIVGILPVNPTTSKEARARAVTPEIESGHVYLPHPGDPGNEWVTDLLNELRNFPHDAHDDQVDALTQALAHLRDQGRGGITNPGHHVAPPRAPAPSTSAHRLTVLPGASVRARAARTDLERPRPRL